MRNRAATMILLVVSILGCTQGGQETASTTPATQAIQQLFEQYLVAFHEEDMEMLRSLYTADAVLLPPDQPVIRGPDAIIDEWYRPMFETFDAEMELPLEEVRSGGDWGFSRGTYHFRLLPEGGGDPVLEEGKYIDVVKREADGTWRIARAIWNTTQP